MRTNHSVWCLFRVLGHINISEIQSCLFRRDTRVVGTYLLQRNQRNMTYEVTLRTLTVRGVTTLSGVAASRTPKYFGMKL